MIGMYVGLGSFCVGAILTLIINRNVKVPIEGDFYDMPLRIKVGIVMVIVGILLFCASIMFMLVEDPYELLRR